MITRRAATAGIAATAGLAAAGAAVSSRPEKASPPMTQKKPGRLPVVFLPHGGGPWPFVDLGFGTAAEYDDLKGYLRSVKTLAKPRALLVISAHWEEAKPTVTTSKAPPLLFDYYGFPKESYELTWPAPGDPALAARVRALLKDAGIDSAEDDSRGYDHGTFVPLKVAFPDADVPVVQLSLQAGLDPATHHAIGKALQPLRDPSSEEGGVLIVGSGMTYHNLRAFGSRSAPVAEAFDAWLRAATTSSPATREQQLNDWKSAPMARLAHPREEHLLPLMVVAGAAGDDVGTVAWNGTFAGLRLSAHHFG